MNQPSKKALGALAIILAVAVGQAAPAFARCHHHDHHAFRNWPDRFAFVSSYWQPLGYGCGPFQENADGWDVGVNRRCYYPSGY